MEYAMACLKNLKFYITYNLSHTRMSQFYCCTWHIGMNSRNWILIISWSFLHADLECVFSWEKPFASANVNVRQES